MPALAQGDTCRHGLHARELPQGRSEQLHPEVVRLDQWSVRRVDPRHRQAQAFAPLQPDLMTMITANRRQLLAGTGLAALGAAAPGLARTQAAATTRPDLFIG